MMHHTASERGDLAAGVAEPPPPPPPLTHPHPHPPPDGLQQRRLTACCLHVQMQAAAWGSWTGCRGRRGCRLA